MTDSALIQLFSLNPGSGIPIYRQLIDQIKQAVRMDLLKADDKLPSVRSLASSLQINPMTISKAFAQLELEGVLIRKRGVGMLVAKQQVSQPVKPELETAMEALVELARAEDMHDEAILTLLQQYLSIHQQGEKV